MRTAFMLLSVTALCLTLLSEDLPQSVIVVVNSGEDTVALVDPKHPQKVEKIATRKHPQDVVVSPDRSLAYIAEMGTTEAPGNTVSVLDVGTRRIVTRIPLGRATRPHLLVLSRGGDILWAACAQENAIAEIDVRNKAIRKLWNTQQKGSYLLAGAPDDKKIYVSNFDSGSVSVINRTDASVHILRLGGQPIGIDVSPDSSAVWVSNLQNNTISVINTADDRIVQTLPAGGDGPARLKFTADGKQVWVTNLRSNELVAFDVAERHIVRRIPTGHGSKGLLVLPDGEHAVVSVMDENQIALVDVAAGQVLQRIPTGIAPEGLAWVFDGHGSHR
jgi:YVTN family beta-propeller protein